MLKEQLVSRRVEDIKSRNATSVALTKVFFVGGCLFL